MGSMIFSIQSARDGNGWRFDLSRDCPLWEANQAYTQADEIMAREEMFPDFKTFKANEDGSFTLWQSYRKRFI